MFSHIWYTQYAVAAGLWILEYINLLHIYYVIIIVYVIIVVPQCCMVDVWLSCLEWNL